MRQDCMLGPTGEVYDLKKLVDDVAYLSDNVIGITPPNNVTTCRIQKNTVRSLISNLEQYAGKISLGEIKVDISEVRSLYDSAVELEKIISVRIEKGIEGENGS